MRELLAGVTVMMAFAACNPVARLREAMEERETQDRVEEDEQRLSNAPPIIGEPGEYGFVHHETTGITSAVLPPGRQELSIKFSEDSDREALRTLYALRPTLFLPNTRGDALVVVGVLDNVELRSRVLSPRGEPYRRFRLTRWYLRAPFTRWSRLQELDELPEITLDTKLRATDFEEPVSGDLSRFVRVSDAGAAPAPNAPAPESSLPRAP